jgi:pimeloyl-ACP methyl ester carboxylesterase
MKSPTRILFGAGVTAAIALAAATAVLPNNAFSKASDPVKPTVVLVHGAFAESSSWDGVTAKLLSQGYPVIAVANPLRGVKVDARYVSSVVDSVQGPVVLVGHSYGGTVISNAASSRSNVKALVYVAAFAPDLGESAGDIGTRFPGGTLGSALAPPVALADGGKDLYIQQDKFHDQFAADVPARAALLMAAAQRPIVESAIGEPSGVPAWRSIPSWFVFGSLDKNIPLAALSFMAERAGSRKTVEVKGASHVVMTSHPAVVARLIDEAARAP